MQIQIKNYFGSQEWKNLGESLLKTLGAGIATLLIAWVGSNSQAIADAFKDPAVAGMVLLVLRGLITVYTEYKKGGNPDAVTVNKEGVL